VRLCWCARCRVRLCAACVGGRGHAFAVVTLVAGDKNGTRDVLLHVPPSRAQAAIESLDPERLCTTYWEGKRQRCVP
jgi:hypothetical protein